MIRASFLFACGSALGVVAALAMAEPPRSGEGATVITGSSVRYLSLPQNDTTEVQLVARRVSVPGVTVSRALSEQPVRPFLAEVKIGRFCSAGVTLELGTPSLLPNPASGANWSAV